MALPVSFTANFPQPGFSTTVKSSSSICGGGFASMYFNKQVSTFTIRSSLSNSESNALRPTFSIRASLSISESNAIRPLAGFSPSKWDDYFITMPLNESSRYHWIDSLTKITFCDLPFPEKFKSDSAQVEVLKENVKEMLANCRSNDPVEKIILVDTLYRLGVSYHFETEIEEYISKTFYAQSPVLDDKIDHDLYTVAVVFRVFRQYGYKMPSNVFCKFMNKDGKFNECLIEDAKGMLSLYEAAHWSTPEDNILDEALAFTRAHLETLAGRSSSHLGRQIMNSLKHPLHRAMPRLEARKYIDFYEADECRNEALLKFAKFDFNRVQFLYQQELRDISQRWKDTNMATTLSYARIRVVESYLWSSTLFFEPHYARARVLFAKLMFILTIMDDTYDAYGTKSEHRCFREAVERWEYAALDQLPGYLKSVYTLLLNTFSEFEDEVAADEGRSWIFDQVKERLKEIVRAFDGESAEWFHEGHLPSLEEYFSKALITGGIHVLVTVSFFGMGEIAGVKEFEWLQKKPRIIRHASVISRLIDDIITSEYEQKRPHIVSSIECYMKQHGVSEAEAIEALHQMLENAWKVVNEEFMKKPTDISRDLLLRVINNLRVANLLYRNVDAFTHEGHSDDFINDLFVNPIPA